MRVQLRAEGAADGAHLLDERLAASDRPRHQIAVAADVLGQRVHRQVHAVFRRLLKDGPQQRVVAYRDWPVTMPRFERIQLVLHCLEIEQRIGRIGGRLDIKKLDRPFLGSRFQRRAHAAGRQPVRDGVRPNAPLRKDLADQRLGAAIKRHGLHQLVARPQKSHQHRADRGHAAGRDRRVLRAVQQRQPVLHDLQVRMIEPAVHQPRRLALRQGLAARHQVKERRAVFGRAERKRGRQKHRRLDRPLGQIGIVAIGHHLGFGMQGTAEDVLLVVARVRHGVPLSGVPAKRAGASRIFQTITPGRERGVAGCDPRERMFF